MSITTILHAQRGLMPPSQGSILSFCGRLYPDQSKFWNVLTMERRGRRCRQCVRAIRKNAKRWT